jgi:hypothetical protein
MITISVAKTRSESICLAIFML